MHSYILIIIIRLMCKLHYINRLYIATLEWLEAFNYMVFHQKSIKIIFVIYVQKSVTKCAEILLRNVRVVTNGALTGTKTGLC